MSKKRAFFFSVIAIFGVGALIQAMPHAMPQSPPVRTAPVLVQGLKLPPDVDRIIRRSCADCHSEGTRWPWYASVPPASWMVRRDVEKARKAMDLSHWSAIPGSRAKGLLAAACADVESARMPLGKYLLMHPDARMSPADRRTFCEWTRAQTSAMRNAIPPAPSGD